MRIARIFLSSRFKEFQDLRSRVSTRISQEDDVEIVNLDDGNPDDRSPSQRSVDEIDLSDVVVILLGTTYNDHGRSVELSVTEREFEHAIARRDSGSNLRIRAWKIPEESSFSDDSRAFLARVMSEIVVGTLPDDPDEAADLVVSDALATTDLLSGGEGPADAFNYITLELDRLGLRQSQEIAGATDVLAVMMERRSIALDALRAGDTRSALWHLRQAREVVKFDLVTNVIFVLLCKSLMVPSLMREALGVAVRLEFDIPYGVDARTPEEVGRLNVLAASAMSNLSRQLGLINSAAGAREVYQSLRHVRNLDETSRPLRVELATISAIMGSYGESDFVLGEFRELWHLYPHTALQVLSSPAFRGVRAVVEQKICDELRDRVTRSGSDVPRVANLRRARGQVIRMAESMSLDLTGSIRDLKGDMMTLRELMVSSGCSAHDVLFTESIDRKADLSAMEFEEQLTRVEQLLAIATEIGWPRGQGAPLDEARRLASDWLDEAVISGIDWRPVPSDFLGGSFEALATGLVPTLSLALKKYRKFEDARQETVRKLVELLVRVEPTLPRSLMGGNPALLLSFVKRLGDLESVMSKVGVWVNNDLEKLVKPPPSIVRKLQRQNLTVEGENAAREYAELAEIFPRIRPVAQFDDWCDTSFDFLGVEFGPVGRRDPLDWTRQEYWGRSDRYQVERSRPWDRVRRYLLSFGSEHGDLAVAARLWSECERLMLEAIGAAAEVEAETKALDPVKKALYARAIAGDVDQAEAAEARMRGALFDKHRASTIKKVEIRGVINRVRDFNSAFATAPAISFPHYVPLSRAGIGDVTRISNSGVNGDTGVRVMARMVRSVVATGGLRPSLSALGWPTEEPLLPGDLDAMAVFDSLAEDCLRQPSQL